MHPTVGKATATKEARSSVNTPQRYTTTLVSLPTMASNIEQSPFFQQQKAKGEAVVRGMAKMSLDSRAPLMM